MDSLTKPLPVQAEVEVALTRMFCVFFSWWYPSTKHFKTNEEIVRTVDKATMLVLECHLWREISSEE